MGTININGVDVFADHVETVEMGVSEEYNRLWQAYITRPINTPWEVPLMEDHPAVVVRLTSGREFRIVGADKSKVLQAVSVARRRRV